MRVVRRKLPQTMLSGMVLTLLMSTLVSMMFFTQPTQALSLKDTTERALQPVQTLLTPVTNLLRPPSSPSTTPPTQTSVSAGSSSGAASAAPNQSTSPTASSSPVASEVIGIQKESSLEKIAPIEQIKPVDQNYSSAKKGEAQLANVFLKNSGVISPVADFGWLQATDNGWRLFGVLWYWWTGLLALLIVCYRFREKFGNIPLLK